MARCLAAGVGGVVLLLAALPGAATPLIIRDARLIDGTGAPPREHVSILVRDGRIAAIGSDLAAGDAVVLDAAGATVLPGLIDSHVHFIAAPGGAFRHDSPDALRSSTACTSAPMSPAA
jgi:imidazolonepropionase-like amidohydrolase